MNRPRPASWTQLFRDLFLGALALAILYDQVVVVPHAQTLLIGLVVFLFASIPALRGDSRPGHYGPFALLVLKILGIPVPEHFQDEADGGIESHDDTPTSSESDSPAEEPPPSRPSSQRSPKP